MSESYVFLASSIINHRNHRNMCCIPPVADYHPAGDNIFILTLSRITEFLKPIMFSVSAQGQKGHIDVTVWLVTALNGSD